MRSITIMVMCLAYAIAGHAQLEQSRIVASTNNSAFDLDLSSVSQFDRATVTLENVGTSPVVMPEITLADGPPGTNSQTILNWLQAQGGASDRALAEAAWGYVNGKMFPQCYAMSAFEDYYETRIPWRLLRGYGFGCCDQEAYTLAWLWHLSGFQSRVITLPGHIVAEIYYGNAWHMYDSNHRVYYTNSDGSVASVAQVVADPTLVITGAGSDGLDPVGATIAYMENLYGHADPTYTTPNWSLTWWYDPTSPLAHGETVLMYSDNAFSDVIRGGSLPVRPSIATSATLIRAIDFSDPNWGYGVYSVTGMQVSSTDTGISLVNTADPGSVLLRKDSPSPAFDLQIGGVFYRTADSTIKVYFSTDGSNWSPGFSLVIPVGMLQSASVNLTNVARGAYLYYVRIDVAGAPGSVRISSLKLTSNVQVAKSSFPVLTPGTVNHLVYRDGSDDGQDRNIRVRVAVYNDPPAPIGMTLPPVQDVIVPPTTSVADLEAQLRVPDTFYPWLAYGSSQASATLWQAQQNGDTLEEAAANSGDYLTLGANLSWNTRTDGPITWSLAKREPVSLNIDWIQTPKSTMSAGTLVEAQSPGDRLVFSSSLGGTIQLLGRPVYKGATVTSLVTEDPIYSLARGYGASHLMDGRLRSLAYPGGTQFDYLADLGESRHVSAALLNWGYFGADPVYIQNWILYGRNEPQDTWQALAQGGPPNAETTAVELDTYASQLRIAASGLSWIGMYELVVNASSPLASSAASNIIENTGLSNFGPASLLVDGNEHTCAYPGFTSTDYTLDPGADAYIDQVRVVWGYYGRNSSYINSWRLYGQKQSGAGWEIIARGGFPNASASLVPVHDSYRRLRIAADAPDFVGNFTGICEVQTYGNLLTR